MPDLRDLLREAAYDVDTRVLREPGQLRELGHRRAVRRRAVVAAGVALTAVVVSAVVAAPPLVRRSEPPTSPDHPQAPCPAAVVPTAGAAYWPAPVLDVVTGEAATLGATGLWVTEAGKKPRQLAAPTDDAAAESLSLGDVWWSPDGAQLLMSDGPNGNSGEGTACSNLVLVQADGGGQRVLSHNRVGTDVAGAAFSSDGGMVAYVNRTLSPHVPTASEMADAAAQGVQAPRESATDALMVVDLATGQETQLDPHLCIQPKDDGTGLRWARDGRRLAVQCTEDEMRMFDLSSGAEDRVSAPSGQYVAAMGWASDGSLLGAIVPRGEPQESLTVSAWDPTTRTWGAPARSSVTVEFFVPFPGFSPDGHFLLATGGLPGQTYQGPVSTTAYLVDTTTGATRTLPLTLGETGLVEWVAGTSDLLVTKINRYYLARVDQGPRLVARTVRDVDLFTWRQP